MSAPARLLDWLALTYNVLIVVSAGNHPRELELGPALGPGSSDSVVTGAARAQQLQDARLRSVLSPAEAVNALTVGALHSDTASGPLPAHVMDVLPQGDPTAYSPGGGGFRRGVKPEVLMPGGRQVGRLDHHRGCTCGCTRRERGAARTGATPLTCASAVRSAGFEPATS